jgi:hypothetical protein
MKKLVLCGFIEKKIEKQTLLSYIHSNGDLPMADGDRARKVVAG